MFTGFANPRLSACSEEREPGNAVCANSRDVHVLPFAVRDQVELHTEFRRDQPAVAYAERRAARREEALWRDHACSHDVGPNLRTCMATWHRQNAKSRSSRP